MKAPTYGLGVDHVSRTLWVVRLREPFLIFCLRQVEGSDWHQMVFPESCAPEGLAEALRADPAHADLDYREYLPSHLARAVTGALRHGPRDCLPCDNGLAVEPITRPGLLFMESGRRQGVLDMRDLSRMVYAQCKPPGENAIVRPFQAIWRLHHGRWLSDDALSDSEHSLLTREYHLCKLVSLEMV
jgi:hypothetical protein